MDNLDDSENNAKISDSAYSNSCSNSQSRRSRSSKSTHSGSNSSGSGSSGYGGKPSTSGSSNALDQPSKKDKESKKKKQSKSEANAVQESAVVVCRPPDPIPIAEPKEEKNDVIETPTVLCPPPEQQAVEDMEIVTSDHGTVKNEAMDTTIQTLTSNCIASGHISIPPSVSDGFSCVISMHDGVVMYTTSNLTTTLGFPKDMWIGRSFIDFVHPRDRSTFASQITNGLAVPKIVNGTQQKAQNSDDASSTMVCRIRKYRGLSSGFGVKDRILTFMPFLLKFTFKNVNDEEGKSIYLVMQATPYYSAFKVPNEVFTKPSMFVMRHDANGHIEYIQPESVPYLGFMPQDIQDKNALKLYHPEDLPYLRQIYETIVKEGNVKSKCFRMMVQNGDYVNLETEWSSFINPWSLKLEFVIGKHRIIKGPENPDVFQSADPEKALKLTEEEKNKAEGLRESIVRIMNEVLTKPAEAAKQQMNKRCQDIALFMERLIENQPKAEDDLRIEIQDPDYSYYERDSVMLGGISPHHEYNDSKSSTETPLSYNQLNYNENLQRYFDSHQPYCYEDYNTVDGENILGLNKNTQLFSNNCPSPSAQPLGDSTDVASSGDSSAAFMIDSTPPNTALRNNPTLRLTEPLLKKHNSDMEKELVKMHRESRCCTKGERKKASDETRQKKKAHLARCNATFQPTLPVTNPSAAAEGQAHGVKRLLKAGDFQMSMHKHHCAPSRQLRPRQPTSTAPAQTSTTFTTTGANWPPTPVNSLNTFIVGVGIPQQMSVMNPLSAISPMTGVFPMYYTPASPGPSTSAATANPSSTTSFPQPAMPCMMYGQPVYGQPLMYTPVNTQVSYPMQQTMMAPAIQYSNNLNPFGLNNNNYEQACKSTLPPGGIKPAPPTWRDTKRTDTQTKSSKVKHGNTETSKALKRSTEAVPGTSTERDYKAKTASCEDTVVDRTDGESSYSSFYSSFFKTESGSADDSGGDRKRANLENKASGTNIRPQEPKKIVRRKIEPPWMEQVCVTSQLIYKYQILTKSMDEVLLSDKEKMKKMEQPSLVNEQLGQLYTDLQLEGVATRLTLEEGITSSSSSGEENCSKSDKDTRRKRRYSKLTMIYEEDAPLPPPDDAPESSPCPSTESLS